MTLISHFLVEVLFDLANQMYINVMAYIYIFKYDHVFLVIIDSSNKSLVSNELAFL